MPLCIVESTFYSDFQLKTLTCNQLSHCLFDFDCTDLNVYQNEVYNYQEFSVNANLKKKKGMIHKTNFPPTETTHDTIITRKDVKISCFSYSDLLSRRNDPETMVLRFMYKPHEGVLWVFNRCTLDRNQFLQIPNRDRNGVVANNFNNTK